MGAELMRRKGGSRLLFEGPLGANLWAKRMHDIVASGQRFSDHLYGEPATGRVAEGGRERRRTAKKMRVALVVDPAENAECYIRFRRCWRFWWRGSEQFFLLSRGKVLDPQVALRAVIRSEPIFDIGQVFSGRGRNHAADGELKRKLLLSLWIGIGDDEIRVKLRERPTFLNSVVQEEVAPVRQLAEKLALNVFWMDVPVQLQSASLWRDAAEIGAVFGKEVSSGVACR